MRKYNYNLQRNPKESFLIYELILSNIESRYGNGFINCNSNMFYFISRIQHN
jgi:hypothetical protein